MPGFSPIQGPRPEATLFRVLFFCFLLCVEDLRSSGEPLAAIILPGNPSVYPHVDGGTGRPLVAIQAVGFQIEEPGGARDLPQCNTPSEHNTQLSDAAARLRSPVWPLWPLCRKTPV